MEVEETKFNQIFDLLKSAENQRGDLISEIKERLSKLYPIQTTPSVKEEKPPSPPAPEGAISVLVAYAKGAIESNKDIEDILRTIRIII